MLCKCKVNHGNLFARCHTRPPSPVSAALLPNNSQARQRKCGRRNNTKLEYPKDNLELTVSFRTRNTHASRARRRCSNSDHPELSDLRAFGANRHVRLTFAKHLDMGKLGSPLVCVTHFVPFTCLPNGPQTNQESLTGPQFVKGSFACTSQALILSFGTIS